MTKLDLLVLVAQRGDAAADEVADVFSVSYPAAAMALLRLVRQGLAARFLDPDSGLYWYELTSKGEARLDYLGPAE